MNDLYVTDLNGNARMASIEMLNARLADAIDLKLAIKQAHWNIRGPSFIALHELLDQVAARMEEHGDTMAERVVQLGGLTTGTTQQVANATSLPPYPRGAQAQSHHLVELRDRLNVLAKSSRRAIDEADGVGDADTADIMTAMSRAIDKDLWLIAAHLE